MKPHSKFLLVLIGVAVLAVAAALGARVYYDRQQEEENSKPVVYADPILNYSVTMPKDWKYSSNTKEVTGSYAEAIAGYDPAVVGSLNMNHAVFATNQDLVACRNSADLEECLTQSKAEGAVLEVSAVYRKEKTLDQAVAADKGAFTHVTAWTPGVTIAGKPAYAMTVKPCTLCTVEKDFIVSDRDNLFYYVTQTVVVQPQLVAEDASDKSTRYANALQSVVDSLTFQ